MIAELLIKFGPIALDWIEDLAAIWSKQMTAEEVKLFVTSKRKSYDDYITTERARRVIST